MAPLSYFFLFPFGARRKNRKEKEVVKKEKGKENEEEVPRHFFFGGVKGGRKQKKGGEKMIYFGPLPRVVLLYTVQSFVRSFVYYTGAITRQRATAVIQTPTPSFFIYSP
jgi:hypothetical protein